MCSSYPFPRDFTPPVEARRAWVRVRRQNRRREMAEPNRRNESEGPSPSDADSYEEEELEIQIEQMDRPLGSDRRGTTAEEQRRGASLEETSPDGQYGRREDRGMQLAEDDAP